MANTTEISIPLQGMTTDLHRLNSDEKGYSFALNAITSDFFTGGEFLLGNEPSNTCSTEFPPNYQVVGFIEIPEQKRTIYIIVNPLTGFSQFGETLNCNFKDVTDKIEQVFCTNCPSYSGKEKTPFELQKERCFCPYTIITSSNCLNFDINFPVDIEYKLTNCGVNLYFTDAHNERGFIYFDYEHGETTDNLILNTELQTYTTGILCNCPTGFTYDVDTNTCINSIITPMVVPPTTRIACAVSSDAYTNFGVALYTAGYSVDGTGTSSIIHGSDTYWSNPGALNDVDGVLNRTALWACDALGNPQVGTMLPLNENIGFIFPIVAPSTKTYYIGIAGDNTVRVRVDCVTIMDMNPVQMALQYPVAGSSAPFKYWHIYPITLSAGRHVIELTGYNYGSVAGFGAEVYDNTSAEIIAATGGTGLNILFSTSNSRGTPLTVSSTFVGVCPGGACADIINDVLVCTSTVIEPAICDQCETTIYTGILDCNKTKVHPNYDKICIGFSEFVNGGNLKEGVYQVLFAPSDVYGNPLTNYSPATPTAPLFNNPIKFETNNLTSKALKFKIENLKNNGFYKYYNLVIAQTIDSFTEFIYVGTFSVSQNEYVYTGFEQAINRLTPQQVLFRYPYYETARGVTKANDYLFYTGVKEYKISNLQPVANNINLYWETVAVKEGAYHDASNTFYFHTYQRDEVYAFGIVFEYANGRETCAFHIPGREATLSDLEIVINADVITNLDCFEDPLNKRWQIYNTGSIINGDYEYNENCEVDKCWEYGNFAYWESTEKYPNDYNVWGELCGLPIRHHKFPDSCITHIHDSANGTKIFKDNNYIFPIGVRVDHASVLNALAQAVVNNLITQKERDSIVSYRIVRGNRVGNKSIDAKGLVYNMLEYTKDAEKYYLANYPYNDLSADDFLNGISNTAQRYTFHSPDVHFVNSGLGNLLKLETEEYGKSEGYFTYSDCQAKHKFLSAFAHTLAFGLGIAAALSATGEKECRVITYKGSDKVEPYTTSTTGETPVGIVAGGGGVLAAGSGTITPNTTTVTNHNFNADTDVPEVIVNHNFADGNINPATGLAQGQGTEPDTGIRIPIENYDKQDITFCKGQPFQVFNSNPVLMGLFTGVNLVIQRIMLGLAEMDKILETMRALIPYNNYTIQYNSVGKYNNYICVPEGNKLRKLDKTSYLDPFVQVIDEPSSLPDTLFETVKINNWDRESSVYLKTATVLANPTKSDNSKTSMENAGLGYDDLNKRFQRDIASYYASVKRYVPNQYGQICNINYLETSGCSFNINTIYNLCETKVFGGDTFINRFALKRKMPFFLHTMCGLPDGSDIKYSELGNVGVATGSSASTKYSTKFYFNTPQPLAERIADETTFFGGILSVLAYLTTDNIKNYDVSKSTVFNQSGYMHAFNYGIPYFLVESDINVDFRHGQNNKEKDFYPHNRDLKNWLEEKNVPIHEDNYYFYNKTYSKQNTESPICTSCILNLKDLNCQQTKDNRLIYSEPTNTENKNDNWRVFKANSYYDFPLNLGRLITADGIENDKVLVRLEKGAQIFNAYNTIQVTEQNIQVGTGGMFQSRPRDIATTDLGYAGTQNKDILHTEYGHIWADAERGQVINIQTGGQGVDELTKEGNRNWFKENLPFQIRKDFPEIPIEDIDNNLNGIGLHYCFDKRFNRMLMTKLDYKVISRDVKYNKSTKKFYVGPDLTPTIVELYNPKYFCNKSWTISYNFFQKMWVSFHSYIPNFYVEHIENFESGYKRIGTTNQKTYLHNASNKSYQVFYGKLSPFIIEFQPKFSVQNNFVNSIEYVLDVIRYHNEFDSFYNRTKTFNKAIIYNERQTSGLCNLVVSNPEDLTEVVNYPKRVIDGYDILVSNSENVWRFNDFWDVSTNQMNNLPIFNYDCNNVDKKLNTKAINYDKFDFDRQGIRDKQCRVRLINDVESNYKFILNFGKINKHQSFR